MLREIQCGFDRVSVLASATILRADRVCDASGSSYRTAAHTVSLSPPYRDLRIDLSAWKEEVMRPWGSDQFVCAIHEAECKLVTGGSMDLSR